MVSCVHANDGWVNKFEGDAALCVFGPANDTPGHQQKALRAARPLQQAICDIRQDHPRLAAGIGVASGLVVAGNIGARGRYEYTAIGDPVNEFGPEPMGDQ